VVLIGPEALHGLGSDVLAQLAILAAACSYGFAGIFGRRFKRMGIARSPPPPAGDGFLGSAGTDSTVHRSALGVAMPSATVWAAIIGLAVVSTALAYVPVLPDPGRRGRCQSLAGYVS
jgi:drug/metabolite transporter (DMT)-like permease